MPEIKAATWAQDLSITGLPPDMVSQIRQLLNLITKSVETLEERCVATKTQIPDLQSPFNIASEAFRSDPAAAEAATTVSAAAMHLSAILVPPHVTAYNAIGGHCRSAAFRFCLESNVTEILREAGPEGLHVNDIAAKSGMDGQKLARCLRLLATEHIYCELKPEVFANNRISTLVDTMKSSKEVIADPEHKYDNTSGFGALASHFLDEMFKGSTYLWENESDPKTAKSQKPEETAVTRALGTDKGLFAFLGQPDQSFRRQRVNAAMRVFNEVDPKEGILAAYEWESLPRNALVVDVGGGVGTVSLVLAQAFSNLNIIIQDLPQVVEDGLKVWYHDMPGALSTGQVKFEAHDFFVAQPQKNASVFFMKNILHDWPDEHCKKILKPLRDAATPNTRLILLELIIPYACRDSKDGTELSAMSKAAPAPLLANWGTPNMVSYILDMCMMVAFNSMERTIDQFDQLLRSCGWEIIKVCSPTGVSAMFFSTIEAVPILS